MIFLKRIVSTLVILHTTTLLTNLPEVRPIFISLGGDCETAGNIQLCNLRKIAYPFDWAATENFSDVCKLIEYQFQDFLNPQFLKWDTICITHTKYDFKFIHDFPLNATPTDHVMSSKDSTHNTYQLYNNLIVENFLDYLDNVVEKYTRRINRLYKDLNTANAIVFIRTDIQPEEAKQFTQLMATYYPLIKYTLIVVNHDKKFNYNWDIPRVQSYYLEKNHDKNPKWSHADEWKKLFIQLGFEQWMSRSESNDNNTYPSTEELE